MMHIEPSNICSAFAISGVIGTKITHPADFMKVLRQAVNQHDFLADRIPGQAFIKIPEAIPFLSGGTGKISTDPSHYVLREYRGKVSAFLRREFAAPVEDCAVVVYTKQAYLDDPDSTTEEDQRLDNIEESLGHDITHILVTVLAFAGPSSQLSPHRFTANLAGGNHEAQVWTADEIRAKAREIMNYDNQWTTVAD